MRKHLLHGLAALSMGCMLLSCTHDFTYEEQEQKASIENAQNTLGFYIPANQDWVMTSTATATFNISGLSGTNATVYVFSNNPYADGYGSILASAPVTSTTTTISDFRLPQYLKKVYVGLKESDGNMVYKYVDVEDGQITANYDFNTTPAQARTRASAVINGDPFTFENTDSYYKTLLDVPSNARDVNTTEDYLCVQIGELYATSDIRSNLNLWSGTVNLYIYGNVTLPASAYIANANIYVLPGSTLNMDKQANYVCRVFVSQNATLNYNYERLETNGDTGLHSAIYNRGTVNLPSDFLVNNGAIIYNEGTLNGNNLNCAPGGNPILVYNFGTIELSGDYLLASYSNMYNEGTITVGGTSQCANGEHKIWWINKGHYTTKQFKISAWNDTYYNYCQLFVKEEAYLHDGQFHMMPNSYMEAATANIGNFQVNMYGNSGINIKGNSHWWAQGDNLYQGFKASGENNYVRLGGTTTVDQHHLTLVAEGKILIGFENLYAPNSDNPWDGPYVDLRENVKRVDFSELNPTYNNNDCGATWSQNPPIVTPPVENQTWTYAFEDNKTRCDFDLNDVVLQVRESEADASKLIVKLVAAGCEYDNYVWLGDELITWTNGSEVHEAFGAAHGVMINTGNNKGIDMPVVETTINKPDNFDFQNADFKIRPFRIGTDHTDEANAVTGYITIIKSGNPEGLGMAPLGLVIPDKWKWPKERVIVNYAYDGFTAWGKQDDLTLRADQGGWYQSPRTGTVYGE